MPSDGYIPKYIDDTTGKVLEYLGEPRESKPMSEQGELLELEK